MDAKSIVRQTKFHLAELAVANGKFAGTVGSLNNVEELMETGYRFISIGADVVGLSQYCHQLFSEITKKTRHDSQSIYGGN